MPLVTTAAPFRLRLLPVLLVVCVVTLCLTGITRPAVAMSGSMPSMGNVAPGAHMPTDVTAPPSASDVHDLRQPCPPSTSDCAQTSVPPAGGDQSVCAHSADALTPTFMEQGPPRSGIPPPVAPPRPPELTRLCVSRT